jgi:hypothetical protein
MPQVTFNTKKLDITYYPTNVLVIGVPPPWPFGIERDDLEQPLLDKFSVKGHNVETRTERVYIFPELAVVEVVDAWPAITMLPLDYPVEVKRTRKTLRV